MISAVFIVTSNGEVLVSHDYRSEVSSTFGISAFNSLLKKSKGGTSTDLLPEKEYDGIWMYQIFRNSLYFVAVSRWKQCPLMCIEMLTKLFSILRHFCGVVSEDTVKTNYILIQEILLEFMDFGYVQLCNSEKLRSLIYSEPIIPKCRPPISDVVQWGLFGLEKPAIPGEASNKPFFTSRTANEMAKEEIFVDVVENLSVFIDKKGTVKRSEINGKIVMKNFITGSIDVKLGLNKDLNIRSSPESSGLGSSASLDYCQFHEMVNLDLFESNRVLQIQPSQGEVDLMTYKVDSGQLATIPFRLQYTIDVRSKDLKVSLLLRSNMPFTSKAPQIVARLRVPRATSSLMSHLTSPLQTAEFVRERNEVVWRIKDFIGGMETKANLLVDDSRKLRPQVKLQRWVRYVTHSNSYVFLLS